jgi:hypothetical protein
MGAPIGSTPEMSSTGRKTHRIVLRFGFNAHRGINEPRTLVTHLLCGGAQIGGKPGSIAH